MAKNDAAGKRTSANTAGADSIRSSATANPPPTNSSRDTVRRGVNPRGPRTDEGLELSR